MCSNSQSTIIIRNHIIDMLLFFFCVGQFWRNAHIRHVFVSVIALILNGDLNFILLHIIIIKIKKQITENEEITFICGKC